MSSKIYIYSISKTPVSLHRIYRTLVTMKQIMTYVSACKVQWEGYSSSDNLCFRIVTSTYVGSVRYFFLTYGKTGFAELLLNLQTTYGLGRSSFGYYSLVRFCFLLRLFLAGSGIRCNRFRFGFSFRRYKLLQHLFLHLERLHHIGF